MAFFRKLKDRLFKSSSRLDEGLEAIVEQGGSEEEAEIAVAEPDAVDLRDSADVAAEEPPRPADPALQAGPVGEPEAEAMPEDVEAAMRRTPGAAAEEMPRLVDPEPQPIAPNPDTAPADAADAGRADDLAADPDLGDGLAADPDLPEEPVPTPKPDVPPGPAPRPKPDLPPDPVPGPGRDLPPDPAPRPEPDVPPDPAPRPEPDLPPGPEPVPGLSAAATAGTEETGRGFLSRMFGRRETRTVIRRELDDEMLEQLEELLIAADMGVDTALRVTANMAEGRLGKRLSVPEIKQLLAGEIARIMDTVARPLPLYPRKPQVVLVVGVNGSGKTTTIGKLAAQFRAAGKSVVVAAGDTFRAAAVEQLQIWGERAGVPVLTAPEGSDPASLAYDALVKAKAEGADLLMIDTAGRLQNRADLMEELAKIVRVLRKLDETAPHNTVLVLDATTGQNALAQVEIFQKVADVTGLVMTKLDGTARGGVLVALADKFGLPIHAIGVGEQIDDLAPFDPEEFAAALTGLAEA